MMRTIAALLLIGSMDLGPVKHDTVTIEHVPDKPCCGSGVLAFYVDLTVRTQKGRHLVLSMAYLSPDQLFPKAGDLCNVAYRRDPHELTADGTARLVVWDISCSNADGSWRKY